MKYQLSTLLLGACIAAGAVEVPFPNGSFEKGTGGYWINRPAAARVDPTDSTDGKQSLAVEPTEGKTVSVVQGMNLLPDHIYTIRFDARTDVPEGGPKLTLQVMLQGAKPIAFFAPKGEQKTAAATPAKLTEAWQTLEYKLGPFPEKQMNQEVKKVLLYINVAPGDKPGKVLLDNIKITADPTSTEEAGQKKNSPLGSVKKGELEFRLPDPVQVFDAVPALTVSAPVGDGALRVTGSDAFGRERFKVEGKKGEESLEVTLPGSDYYAVKAEVVENGKVVQTAATSLLVTTPLPADYYDTPQPAFGVWGGLTPKLRRLAGAKWDRQLFVTHLQKPDFQAAPPTPEAIAEREPVKIIRCLNVMNPFKKMIPLTAAEWPLQREKLEKEITSRRGLVDVWETQNEPMVGENYHGTMADVMEIIRTESAAIRSLDPGKPIAGVCINPMNANQYNQYVGYYRNHGIQEFIDAVMLHPYIPGAQSPDASGYVDVLNRLARDLKGITGKNVPMYISEIGYSTKPFGEVTELQQAAYLARVVLLNRQIPDLVACVWHIGLWNDATSQRELDFGLLRKHAKGSPFREPKPAFAAWATVSRLTYDAKYLRELEISRQIRALLFERNGKPLLAVYTQTPAPAEFQLALNAPEAVVTEVCGRSETVKTKDGILALTLTEAPVYIEGGALENFEAGRFAAAFTPEEFRVVPGKPLTVKVNLPEALAGKDARLRVQEGPFGPVEVKGSGRNWQLIFAPPAKLAPGGYDLFLRLETGGRSRYIWQKTLEVLPPLSLEKAEARPTAKGPVLEFTVKANDPAAGEATMEILENQERVLAAVGVKPGQAGSLPLSFTRQGRKSAYQARFTTPGGYRWMQPLAGDLAPVAISRLKHGSESAGGYAIADGLPSRHAVSGEFDRPEGTIRLAWDDERLYFFIDELDHTFRPRKGAALWDGDSLQIGLSAPQSFMLRPNNDGIQETAYAEFGVTAENESWVWASMNLERMPLHQPVPAIKNESRRDGNRTLYRFSIPWATLNLRPKAGMPLGISILVNDRDEKDRHWIEWYGGIADGKDPSRYGTAILLAE